MSWCEQNAKICAIGVMKFEVFILGGQRIDQKRKKGWWQREEIERKETKGNRVNLKDKEHRHLPMLEFPRGTTLLLSSRLDSAVKRFCSEVLFSSGAAW